MAPRAHGRFVEVPSDRILGRLREVGASVEGAKGSFEEGRVGREVVVDLVPPHGRAMVRVYTTVALGQLTARGCGEDAVRLLVCCSSPEGIRQLAPPRKILRTASTGKPERARVEEFLERLVQAMREAYALALGCPACPSCGRAMALREARGSRFYGCSGFPSCRVTRAAG